MKERDKTLINNRCSINERKSPMRINSAKLIFKYRLLINSNVCMCVLHYSILSFSFSVLKNIPNNDQYKCSIRVTRWKNLITQDNDVEISFTTQYMFVVCHEHIPGTCLPFSKPDGNSDSGNSDR